MKFLFLTLLLVCMFLQHSVAVADAKVGYADIADTTNKKSKARVIFPVPVVPRLFYIQRDPNSNTIIYDLNMNAAGQPDNKTPIRPYWIKYNEKGQKEELNFIQRKFAYGVEAKAAGNNKFNVRIVAYKKYPLTLMQSATDKKYHIYATIAKKVSVVNRIFIKIDGGTFWIPNVIYIEVKGTDAETGKEVMERFKP